MTTPGALIAGRYRLRTRVASGGMGSVWEAEDEVLGRRVAVKLLLPQPGISASDAEIARNRVIREARITARLHHPHAVTLYDVVEHAGQPCLIMQFVPSRSLNAILQERGVLPEQMTARIGAELASALTAAHLAGIVHRDVKPSNVLITPDGSAKLTDFGISHAVGDVNLTSTGMVSGTPAYLAPEVARGAASGFPADVFSLGATLYATLEGTPPFGTDVNPMAILHRVASGQVILPRRSGSLTPLLLHMLAPVPGNRPTMADVARALTAAAEGFRAPAEPERVTTALPPPTVRDWPADPPVPPVASSRSRSSPAGSGSSDSSRSDSSRSNSSLSDSLLGAGHLPDPPGTARPISVASRAPGPRRRPLALVVGVAVVVIGLVALGVVLLTQRSGGPSGVAATTGSAASSAVSASSTSPPSPKASAAAGPLPVTRASVAATRSSASTARSATSPSRPATTGPATTPATTSTKPTTSTTRTTTSPSTSTSASSPSSTSSSSSTSSTPTSSAVPAGAPTGGQLAAAVTDYYAQLPGGTDNGWAHLTENFRKKIANGRGNYQRFWDGIESVSLSNVTGTAPGTVTATVTYRLEDGTSSRENTTFRLVRSDGILKIDSQE